VSGIPNPMNVNSQVSGALGTSLSGSLGTIGPITVAGLPDTYHLSIDKLPTITLGEITTHSRIDPVDVTAHIAIEKIPDIRAHLPANFSVGLSLLGVELMCLRLCGEALMITEPYRPNPCESCGRSPQREPGRGEPAVALAAPEG
jgi:hypothetical protein